MHPRTAPALPRRLAQGVIGLVVALGLLTGCGSDDPEAGADATTGATTESTTEATSPPATSPATTEAPPAQAQSITATEADFSISLDRQDLTAGEYQIQVVNDGGMRHNLVVERDGQEVAASDTIGPGESTTVAVTLEPGGYVFFCGVGNHRAMGMEISVQVT